MIVVVIVVVVVIVDSVVVVFVVFRRRTKSRLGSNFSKRIDNCLMMKSGTKISTDKIIL